MSKDRVTGLCGSRALPLSSLGLRASGGAAMALLWPRHNVFLKESLRGLG